MVNMYKGAFLSLMTVFLWAVSNIFLRYCLIEHNCNQFAIACSNILFSGLALIAIGGKKTNVKEIITNYQTWVFGFLQIFRNLFMLMAFVYISATQANLLANVEIVFAVLLSWALFKRKPGSIDFVAMVFIFLGCFILIADLPLDIAVKSVVFVVISALLNNARTIFAEVHHDNKATLSVKERLSVTGWILFVSALSMMIVAAILGFAVCVLPQTVVDVLPFLRKIPAPAEYIALNNLLSGFINAVCIYAASMYCYLYAVSLSNSEYFMMFRSTQALFTYFVEALAGMFMLLPRLSFSSTDWFAAITIMLSSACMVLMRTRRGQKLQSALNELFH
ncbi:MAG: DMT family transporter [Alphaproteobacteria bacterium]|nr:DMT family transporter [Alphaproteobacteria bacterium]